MWKDIRNTLVYNAIFALALYNVFGSGTKALGAGLACAIFVTYLIDILEELRKMNDKSGQEMAEPRKGCGGNCKCKDKNVLQG